MPPFDFSNFLCKNVVTLGTFVVLHLVRNTVLVMPASNVIFVFTCGLYDYTASQNVQKGYTCEKCAY
jgi:hypothetical protein